MRAQLSLTPSASKHGHHSVLCEQKCGVSFPWNSECGVWNSIVQKKCHINLPNNCPTARQNLAQFLVEEILRPVHDLLTWLSTIQEARWAVRKLPLIFYLISNKNLHQLLVILYVARVNFCLGSNWPWAHTFFGHLFCDFSVLLGNFNRTRWCLFLLAIFLPVFPPSQQKKQNTVPRSGPF